MAEKNKKYYWLKLKNDFFKRHDIKVIEGMDNGKDYILFYLKLLVESVGHEGELRFSETIPYNEKMLSTITNTNIDIVRQAIKIFTELALMEIFDDGTIYLQEVQKMIGHESYWAEKKRNYNDRRIVNVKAKELPQSFPYKLGKCEVLSREQIRLPNGTVRFVDEKRYGGNGMIAIAKANGVCEKCGSDKNIIIHHQNGYSNEQEDLIVLCSRCHGVAHKGGKFPTDVQQVLVMSKQEIEKELDIDKDKEIYINIVDYLNKKAGTRFKADIRKTRDLIKARLNEGFLDIDFFTVIDTKVKEWINNKEMKKYLRPETLFSNKFEGYLNQAGEVKSEVINLPFIEED